MSTVVESINSAEVQRATRARNQQIKALRRLKRRVAERSALQALQVQGEIDHLERLNREGRGSSRFTPISKAGEARPHRALWFW
jgi:hypothetical protein